MGYLLRQGRFPSFAVLGEQILSHEEAQEQEKRYLELIDYLSAHPLAGGMTPGGIPQLQVSIKPSSLTCDFNPADPWGTLSRIRGPLEKSLETARQTGASVNLDVEQCEYRDLTWHIFTQILGPGTPFASRAGAASFWPPPALKPGPPTTRGHSSIP